MARGRPRTFDRDVALERAAEVFAASGFGGTSLDELMRATGVGRQSLYDTFGSKAELCLEALERAVHRQQAALERLLEYGARSPGACLMDWIGDLEALAEGGQLALRCRLDRDLPVAAADLGNGTRGVQTLLSDLDEAYRKALGGAVLGAKRTGEAQSPLSAVQLTRALLLFAQSLGMQSLAGELPATSPTIEPVLIELLGLDPMAASEWTPKVPVSAFRGRRDSWK